MAAGEGSSGNNASKRVSSGLLHVLGKQRPHAAAASEAAIAAAAVPGSPGDATRQQRILMREATARKGLATKEGAAATAREAENDASEPMNSSSPGLLGRPVIPKTVTWGDDNGAISGGDGGGIGKLLTLARNPAKRFPNDPLSNT